MIKKLPLILILFCSALTFGQEFLGEINHSLKKSSKSIRGSLSIVNHKNNDIATFISDKNNIYCYLTNSKFESKKQLTLTRNRRFSGIVGKTFTSDKYTFIVSDNNTKRFDRIEFDFKNDTAYYKNEKFYAKGMTLLQCINKGDKSHLLFLKHKTSDLVVKTYFSNGNSELKTFSIRNKSLLLNDSKETSLSKLLFNVLYNDYTITKLHSLELENNTSSKSLLQPIPIESATDFTKLYVTNDTINIVFDKNKFYTQILSLDLAQESISLTKVRKPFFEIPSKNKTTNSFLLNNLLFSAACTKEQLKINVYDLVKKSLIKSFVIDATNSFPFPNYKMVIKGKKHRNSKFRKKLLKQLSFSDIGIFVEQNSDGYQIIIGGKKPATLDNPMIGVNMSNTTYLYSVNNYRGFLDPHSYILNVYRKVKSTYFTFNIDENLTPATSKIKKNVYHTINRFLGDKEFKNNESHFFRLNQKTIYSYYDEKNNSYKFLAF
jgi:hypothetical protein